MDPRTFGEIMVIGGAEIYRQALPLAGRIELTEVDAAPEGDTVLPAFDADDWVETAREAHPPSEGRPGYAFVTLERRERAA
jgi:dihydrofolate reductase